MSKTRTKMIGLQLEALRAVFATSEEIAVTLCRDTSSGAIVPVIVAEHPETGAMMPLARLFESNPYALLEPLSRADAMAIIGKHEPRVTVPGGEA